MPTKEELTYFQRLPLDVKVAKTRQRITEWVDAFGINGVYVSFSGGKDSTVLLHLVREMYPDVPAVFVNTGLEFPEIQQFVRKFDNVVTLTPKMRFPEVIKTYGYPFISKDIGQAVYEAKRGLRSGSGLYSYRLKKLNGELISKDGQKSKFNAEKYKPLLYTDLDISDRCCYVMKKSPSKKYECESKRRLIVGTMASESAIRQAVWLKEGCNAFDVKRPSSKPMSFWNDNDVLKYIKENNIEIASVYGDVVPADNQLSMFDDEPCKYCTTGCYRTGCIFCGFGAHLDKVPRFKRLKETHPKQYNYCIGGGEYDINGIWIPNKNGLGMGHVIDKLNELYSKNGKPFIDY